ncbi:MAG: two pore domain potassium channel family protein [Gammaproteobacteria bacterium]|nr:two pore domain potassium channel family protein [Gammaproteobacteria bacterium]
MSNQSPSRDNFSYLTIALVVLLLFSAAFDQFWTGTGETIMEAAFVLALIAGVWSIRRKRHFYRGGIGLIAGIVLVSLGAYVLEYSGLTVVHLVILLSFFLLTAWVAVRQVVFSGRIDENSIVGAICIYLLLGMIWAMLYMLMEHLVPGSFKGLPETDKAREVDAFLYFSFISLTTMGFGDITPTLPLARFLTYMEGIVGQFYLAILVASLVSAHLSEQQSQD